MTKEHKKYLTPRDIASAKKKEHIFNISMELFQQYGYNNVTMKTISRESGISEGSIYNFFGEKAGILSMLTEQLQQRLYPLIEPNEENLKNPMETIYRYMMAQSDEYEKLGKDIGDVYLSNSGKHFMSRLHQCENFMATVKITAPDLVIYLETAIEENRMECTIDHVEFAYILASQGSGMLHTWISYGGEYSLHDTTSQVFRDVIRQFVKNK
ncbi:MAG: TetR/AcrR family transcriptional regulator [Lachnospiraceae bacterium]|nr:TetR/AcrR family transcriptional regulator [Lachnospiraceae bacterium]